MSDADKTPGPDEISSDQFAEKIKDMMLNMEKQAKERHRINGIQTQLFMKFDMTLQEIASLMTDIKKAVDANTKRIDAHEYLLRGVDGNNGLVSTSKLIDKRLRYLEIRIVGVCAALAGLGILIGKTFHALF